MARTRNRAVNTTLTLLASLLFTPLAKPFPIHLTAEGCEASAKATQPKIEELIKD